MRKCFALFVCSVLLTTFAARAGQVVIRAGNTLPDDHAVNLGFFKFKELVAARSNGEIVIDIFTNGQLGSSDRELLDAAQMNNIGMCSVAGTNVTATAKEFSINDLFFAYDSPEMAWAVFDGPAGRKLLASLERVGLKGLPGMEDGFRNLTNNRRTVLTVDDLRGIKMRVAENPVQIAAWKALGASPTPMAWGELFTAMQQGTLDGQECTVVSIDTMHFYEVQKFMSLTRHNYTSHFSIFSKELWDGLTPAQQTLIEECHAEAVRFQRNLATERTSGLLDKLRALGTLEITELNPEQMATFRERCRDVNEKIIKDRVGADLYDLFMSEIEKFRTEN